MFQFNKQQFNRLFPYYLLINNKMFIEDAGIGYATTLIKTSSAFNSNFIVIQPDNKEADFETLKTYSNQAIILQSKTEVQLQFRGQVEYIEQTGNILFACAPDTHNALTQSATIAASETEKKLETQRKFYEDVLNSIPSDIAVFNTKHEYLFVNPVAIKDAKVREWIVGKRDEDFCLLRNKPLSVAENRRKLFNSVMETGVEKEWEEKIINREGKTEFHLRKMYPLTDHEGNIKLLIGYGVNITERKKSEEQIRLSEKRYKDLFDFSQALICTHDLAGTILTVNPSTCRLLEYNSGEMIGKKLYDFIPEGDRTEFQERYLNQFNTNDNVRGVFCVVSKSGKNNYLLYQNYKVKEPGLEPYIIGFSQDITERKKIEEAIRNGEDKYRSIIKNMNLGMVELDKDSNIVFANENLCKMSGYSMEELIDKKLYNVFSAGPSRHFIKQKMYIKNEGVSEVYEFVTKNKRGEPRWWLVSGAPILTNNSEFKGSLAICLDITEQKFLEQDLRRAKQQAEESGRAKEMFLANMSHEIRTPMNAILGMGKQMERTMLDGQQQFYLNVINTAASNLLVIINDILDFSKIDAGKLVLDRIGFNIKETINKSLQVILHKAEEKGLELTADIDPAINPVLIGDPHRFNQVLINLLSNSVKFTERGSVKIRCMLLTDNIADQCIRVEVIDTGIGMGEDFQNTLFDKFMQENNEKGKEFSGTGLGMSIVKDLVELMNGNIKVSSKKNAGTAISIEVSFTKGKESDLPKKEEKRPGTNTLSNKRILLVEDNEMNRIVATTVLRQYGAIIDPAINGAEAVEAIRHNSYDIVLMDMRMPVMDGIEATQIIRQQISATIPIIALTANAIDGEEQKCIKAGMNDFLAKPFEEEELVQVLAKWLGIKNIYQSKGAREVTETKTALYNLDGLKSISRGNKEFIVKMLDVFIKGLKLALEQFNSGLEENDIEKIKSTAHRIKPSLSNLSVDSIKDEILYLEKYDLSAFTTTQFTEMIKKAENILNTIIEELEDILTKDSITA